MYYDCCSDGSSYVLHHEIAEDEAIWGTLFSHLIERGLNPNAVRLIVNDDAKGLLAAMELFSPKAQQQRCITHRIRGMNRHLTYQDLPTLD